ncbi:ABC transporter substrate-binding protein [Frankia sp. QA3]|uniref:ABC transporter substrate-binding protein n=1 Tax=Frankia sp. QA3 TaxID=710111 RepID=UPI000269C0D5|nr:ABC transporter substrate-binding protein [Frankia sp. QA3]EIV92026.1 ABC-type branched-chain amino acid transport system, periplasmic component [Frankia sp. QA3]
MRRCAVKLGMSTILLGLVVGTGGCSGTTASAASCTGGRAAPGVTPDEVRVGLLYPDSGLLAGAFPALRAGVDARLGEANAAGGIHGRKVVYEWRDDAGTAEANLNGARELVEQRGVFGMLEFTVAAAGSAQYLADRGIPTVGLAAEDVWTRYRNMFSFSNTLAAPIDTYGRFVHERGGTSAFLLRNAMSAGVSGATLRVGQSMQALGVQVVGSLAYTPDADSVSDVARQIVDSGADTIVTMLTPAALPPVLRAIREAGGSPKVVLSMSGYDHSLLRRYGPDLAGVFIPVFYRPFEAGGAPIAHYLDAMARYSPQTDSPEQEFGLISYIDTDLFLRGLQAAGPCPTRQSFLAGMRTLTHYDAGGLIQPTNIGASQGRQPTCLALMQVDPSGSAFGVAQNNLCGRELGPAL